MNGTTVKHLKLKPWLAVLALALTTTVNAQTAAAGPYVEASVGWAHSDGDFARQVRDSLAASSTYQFVSARSDRSGGAGGRLALGWTFNPHLAVELGYTDFGRYDALSVAAYRTTTAFVAYRKGRYHVSAATLDAVAQFPVNQHFTLSARVGVAMAEQTYSQTNATSVDLSGQSADLPTNRQTRLHWGVGARHAITSNLAVVANYTRIENVGHDFSSVPIAKGTRAGKFSDGLLGVGLRYTF